MARPNPRPILVAAGVGAAVPIATALCIGIAISLSYSYLFMSEVDDADARLATGQRAAERIQAAAPAISTVLLFAGAIFVGRRIDRAPHAAAIGVAVGGASVGTAIAAAFGAPPDWTTALHFAVDFAVAELGVALGYDRSRAALALNAAAAAFGRARTEADIVVALYTACASLGLRRASLHRIEGGRILVRTASAPATASGSIDRVDLFRQTELRERFDRGDPIRQDGRAAVLWIPLLREGEPFAALELDAAKRTAVSPRREPLWKAVGAQASLALANLDLLEQVRVAASRQERRELSADIHDTLAQNLVSAVVHLEAAQQKKGDAAAVEHHLGEALKAAREGVGHARSLVWSSRDGGPREPLDEALARAVHDFEAQSGIAAKLTTVGDAVALGSDGERLLLRATREGLTNVRKHARASHVHVTLTYMEESAALDIADDGRGFDGREEKVHNHGLGFGLPALRELAATLDGSVSIESEPASGTTLSVQLPAPSRRAS